MFQTCSPRMLLLSVLATLALVTAAYSQTAQSARDATLKVWQVTECEGIDNCTIWTFFGKKGYATWRTGERAELEVVSETDDKIEIQRTDVTGSKQGLTADYTGTIDAAGIGGEYKSFYQGRSASDHWYWRFGEGEVALPPVMHFCAMQCATLVWDQGHYFVPGAYGGNGSSIWTIESFTRESVMIDRSDSSGYTAHYTGKMSSEGDSLINGAIDGTPNPFRLTWGVALKTIPGSTPTQAIITTPGLTLDQGIRLFDDAAELSRFLLLIMSAH